MSEIDFYISLAIYIPLFYPDPSYITENFTLFQILQVRFFIVLKK